MRWLGGTTCGSLRMDNRGSPRGSDQAYSHNTRNTWSQKTYKLDGYNCLLFLQHQVLFRSRRRLGATWICLSTSNVFGSGNPEDWDQMEEGAGSELYFLYSIGYLALTLVGYSPTLLQIVNHPTSFPQRDVQGSFGVLSAYRRCTEGGILLETTSGLVFGQHMPQTGQCAKIWKWHICSTESNELCRIFPQSWTIHNRFNNSVKKTIKMEKQVVR